MTTPPTRRRENTQARLLDAAAQLFAEVGLEGASVEAICERAGFTRGAFYSNYASKEELFLDLVAARADARLESASERVAELDASGALTGEADLLNIVQIVMRGTASDDRLSVQLMSETRLHALRDTEFAAAYRRQERAMIASVAAMVETVARRSAYRLRVPAEQAAQMLMTVWEGALVHAAIEGLEDGELGVRASAVLGAFVELLADRG